MPEATATLRIVGKDDASKELGRVRKELDDLKKNFERLEKQQKKTGDGFSDMSGKVRRGIAALGLGVLGKEIISSASNLEELSSKAKFVFGEQFPIVEERTEAVASAVGRASSAILQMSADLGAVIDATGVTGPLLAEMSTGLSKLAVDLASFHNAADTDAFIALRSAITGETEPMKRFGVVMTQTNLSAFALSKGIKGNIQDLNQAQQTVLRYNFVLNKTKTVQGDAERTARGFANQLRRTKGMVRELYEELGEDALPVFADGLGNVSGFLQDIFIPAVRTATQETGALISLVSQSREKLKFIDGGFTAEFLKSTGALRENIRAQRNLIESEKALARTSEVELNRTIQKYNELHGTSKTISAVGTETLKIGAAAESVADQIESLAGGSGSATGKASEELSKHKDALEEVGIEYWEMRSDVDRSLRELAIDHGQSMQEIQAQLKDTEDAVADLERSYKRGISSIDQSEADLLLSQKDAVAALRNEIEETEQQFASRTEKGGSIKPKEHSALDALRKELARETKALSAIESQVNDAVADLAQKRSELTEAQKRFADLEQRREDTENEFARRKEQLKEEEQALENKARAETEAFESQREELEKSKGKLIDFHDTYVENMRNLDTVTKDTVESLNKRLGDLQTVISQIDALMQREATITGGTTLTEQVRNRAIGGIVTEQETMVGESGPELLRLPYGSTVRSSEETARRGMSGSVSVTIGEVHVHDEADENRLIEKITRMIQLQRQQAA